MDDTKTAPDPVNDPTNILKRPNCAVVLLCDAPYFPKASRTILDLRVRGQWHGDTVLVTVGFNAPDLWKDFYRVETRRIEHSDLSELLEKQRKHPIRAMDDQRHTKKLTQWDKMCFFEPWVQRWDWVLYLDAGYRVVQPIERFWNLRREGKMLSHEERHPVLQQFDLDANPGVTKDLKEQFGSVLERKAFQNGLLLFDTSIVDKVSRKDLEEAMNRYPISLVNEMGILNLLAHQRGIWEALPEWVEGTYLVGWCESDQREQGLTWKDYGVIKYCQQLPFGI